MARERTLVSPRTSPHIRQCEDLCRCAHTSEDRLKPKVCVETPYIRGHLYTQVSARTWTHTPQSEDFHRCAHTKVPYERGPTDERGHTHTFLWQKWFLTSNWWPLHTSLCEDLRVCHTNEDQVTSEDSFENTVHLRTHTHFYRQPRTRVCMYQRQCEDMSSDGRCFIYSTISYAEAYSSKNSHKVVVLVFCFCVIW